MLNTRLIREDDALLQFETFAWLIKQYGLPIRPAVPSPLHKSPQLSDLKFGPMDTRSRYLWAEDSFITMKEASHMSGLGLQLVPIDHARELELAGASHDYLVYDPDRCSEAGYFPSAVLLQLADIRSRAFQPEAGLTPLMQNMVVLISGVYSGVGFSLANLVVDISDMMTTATDFRRVSFRIIENTLCFATSLSLMVQRQSMEQVIATYGTLMQPGFRRKIRQAYRQLSAYQEDIKLLQVLGSSPPPALHLPKSGWGPRYQAG